MAARERIPAKNPVTYKFWYTAEDVRAAASIQNFVAVGIHEDWAVTGIRIHNVTRWTGAKVSSLRVQVGTIDNPAAYTSPFELAAPSSANLQLSNSFAEAVQPAHDIVVRFTAMGANLNALTAGQVEITVRIEPL